MTVVAVGLDVVLIVLLLHAVVNAALLRRLPVQAEVDEPVSILLPVRNEAGRIEACLTSLLSQRALLSWELLVYDDESTDGTVAIVQHIAGTGARIVPTVALPSAWLGKPHACSQLGAAASGTVLVFVDADVVLAPDAVARSVALLRQTGLAFVSPYPRQLARSWLERLVQPLLQWSWLTFLPLRVAERSGRPSLAAANGQLLVVDAAAYRRSGGHAAVRDDVLDDVALARRLTGEGAHGVFVDGRDIAVCRMYDGPADLVGGYAKSLWAAFGSPVRGAVVAGAMLLLGLLPWLLLAWTPWAAPAAAAGPLGRLVTAIRAGNRPLADALAQPLSVLAFAALMVTSIGRHTRGRTTWKGRSLP